jgi:hypothetical protein
MTPRSKLNHIQLQSHPSLLKPVLRSAYLAVLHSLALLASVSQGQVRYSMPTMHRPVKDDKVRSLCLHQPGLIHHPGPAVHPSHSKAQPYSCQQGQTSGNPRCDSGWNCASGQPSMIQCVFTMVENIEQRLLHHVPTELAIDRSILPPPYEVSEGRQRVYAAIHSKFQDTMRKVPHVRLPCDAFILSLQ